MIIEKINSSKLSATTNDDVVRLLYNGVMAIVLLFNFEVLNKKSIFYYSKDKFVALESSYNFEKSLESKLN